MALCAARLNRKPNPQRHEGVGEVLGDGYRDEGEEDPYGYGDQYGYPPPGAYAQGGPPAAHGYPQPGPGYRPGSARPAAEPPRHQYRTAAQEAQLAATRVRGAFCCPRLRRAR